MADKNRCSMSEIVNAVCERLGIGVPHYDECSPLFQALTKCGCCLSYPRNRIEAVEGVPFLDASDRKKRIRAAMNQTVASAAPDADAVTLSVAAREMATLALTLQYQGIREKRRDELLAVFGITLEVLNPAQRN